MRIIIKGGVWKNTEDEILKAAVMKYGKNQWARVASLLSRKTAGQCKARWYEWLDPSVKKTEWNKDEEEKLLHLAKLMPNQWRTIAPIVGRTAGQCMEHYERLLDQAQEGGASAEDDPRRLKQGEIDPTPESKPARPDPIDMDEDEKEMLSEARARLANTKGKKAKRKARERQLEDARRLSVLQKRRELKAAGIESKLGHGKSKNINYRTEIPFQKLAPAGFYDVSDEVRSGKAQNLNAGDHGLDIAVMEGKHLKAEEEREKKQEEKRLKILFKANAPLAVAQVNALNDPTALRRRVALSMPEPQVSDAELEDIVKISAGSMGPPDGSRGAMATQALVGDYSTSLLENRATPLRTPLQENTILQEARNLRILRDVNPLLDHQNDVELPELQGGFGFEGVDPRTSKLATPNSVLATPMSAMEADDASVHQGSVSSRWTGAGSGAGAGRAVARRDHFGLNQSEHMSDTASLMSGTGTGAGSLAGSHFTLSSRVRDKELRAMISAQLRDLPEPEYTYDIAIPEVEKEPEDGPGDALHSKPEDAAEVLAELEQQRDEARRLTLARRSAVIKRGLPRPPDCSLRALQSRGLGAANGSASSDCASASALINEEMVRLMARDAYEHPDAASARAERLDLPEIEDGLLERARESVAREVAALEGSSAYGGPCPPASFSAAWEDVHRGLACVPSNDKKRKHGGGGDFVPSQSLSKNEVNM
jgi:pre-mRNA-splicing factor CDC5/CEF1